MPVIPSSSNRRALLVPIRSVDAGQGRRETPFERRRDTAHTHEGAGPQERLVFAGNTVSGIGGRVVRHQARPATVAGSAGPCCVLNERRRFTKDCVFASGQAFDEGLPCLSCPWRVVGS